MTPTTGKTQSPPRNGISAKRWILIIVLVLLLFAATRATPALSSRAPSLGNLLVVPGHTPTAAVKATGTLTNNRAPSAAITKIPASSQDTMVKVSGYSVNLRAGPSIEFSNVRKLVYGEALVLKGRMHDNDWLYVKTSGGQDGWINATWVNLNGVDLDYYPVQTPIPPSSEIIATVYGGLVNLRAGPGINFSNIRRLDFGEPLVLKGRMSDNSWLYAKTSDGQEGWIKTTWVNLAGVTQFNYNYLPVKTSPPAYTSTPVILAGIEGRWIDIDLSEQMLYAYEGTVLVGSFLISTGIDRYLTETGRYHIDVKLPFSDMRGDDYFLPDVPFTMYYYGDFAIHGTYWHRSFGTPMSRGCINMNIKDAEWLYNWASVGTLVNIHR